ncbi:hypothetical protein M231_03285 [Tremella mesenterica]|uniref:DDE Tnp4 domain-containing protein n=1 Tax=Tremella mesenterica TaxID=5217 RepID=A0A4Q1BNY7_TREME|nr:hypothetical protein M231_03285 [Tremella mesenterica]
MPSKTPRAHLLNNLEDAALLLFPLYDDPTSRACLEDIIQAHHQISANRYLDRHPNVPNNAPRPSFYHSEILLFAERGIRHKQAFRMSPSHLDDIVDFFKDDPVFFSRGNKPQAPPKYQIGLLVYRMAHGHDCRTLDREFGVATGTVFKWCDRALIAILGKRSSFISWPSPSERLEIKARFLSEYSIPHCVGLIDGYHANLSTAPARDDAGAYHSRKERYGFNVMAIVDHTKRFRYIHYGYPASSSDQRVQRAIEPLNTPSQYFSSQEYLLADSGFTASSVLVPMFKKSAGQAVLRGKTAYFNSRASVMRVGVEHSIGVLKARWTILRSMSMRLRTKRDEAMAHAIIVACTVLHNILINTDQYYTNGNSENLPIEPYRGNVVEDEPGDDFLGAGRVRPHMRRRQELVEQMLALETEEIDLDNFVLS